MSWVMIRQKANQRFFRLLAFGAGSTLCVLFFSLFSQNSLYLVFLGLSGLGAGYGLVGHFVHKPSGRIIAGTVLALLTLLVESFLGFGGFLMAAVWTILSASWLMLELRASGKGVLYDGVFMPIYGTYLVFLHTFFTVQSWTYSSLVLLGAVLIFYLAYMHFLYHGHFHNRDVQPLNSLVTRVIFYSLILASIPVVLGSFVIWGINLLLPLKISSQLGPVMYSFIFSMALLTAIGTQVTLFGIVARIDTLLHAMKRMLKGHFETRLAHTHVSDELSMLSEAFNVMAEHLESYKKDFDRSAALLEQKVLKRTSQLHSKSIELEELSRGIIRDTEVADDKVSEVIAAMADGVCVFDKSFTVTQVNRSFSEIFGISGPVEGRSLQEILKVYKDLQPVGDLINSLREQARPDGAIKLRLQPPLEGVVHAKARFYVTSGGDYGGVLLFHKTTQSWGVVFDSQTREPVQGVSIKLMDEQRHKVIENTLTDSLGRYVLHVEPGTYYLMAVKDGYHFPSQEKLGYHGEIITVREGESMIIGRNIYIDKE